MGTSLPDTLNQYDPRIKLGQFQLDEALEEVRRGWLERCESAERRGAVRARRSGCRARRAGSAPPPPACAARRPFDQSLPPHPASTPPCRSRASPWSRPTRPRRRTAWTWQVGGLLDREERCRACLRCCRRVPPGHMRQTRPLRLLAADGARRPATSPASPRPEQQAPWPAPTSQRSSSSASAARPAAAAAAAAAPPAASRGPYSRPGPHKAGPLRYAAPRGTRCARASAPSPPPPGRRAAPARSPLAEGHLKLQHTRAWPRSSSPIDRRGRLPYYLFRLPQPAQKRFGPALRPAAGRHPSTRIGCIPPRGRVRAPPPVPATPRAHAAAQAHSQLTPPSLSCLQSLAPLLLLQPSVEDNRNAPLFLPCAAPCPSPLFPPFESASLDQPRQNV